MAENVHRPLAVYRFRLTAGDALAYERLPRELTGWQKVAFIIPLILIGGLAGLLEDWSGLWWWGTVGLLVLLFAAGGLFFSTWRMHRRARQRAARESQTEVEEWGDRLIVRSQAGTINLAYETIGKVIVGDHHVFVLYRDGSVVLPQRAFGSHADMRVFGEMIDRRSIEAEP